MTDGIEIRRATLADRDVIFDLHVDSVTTQCGSHYSGAMLDNWFAGRGPENYTGAVNHGAVWIARCGDVPVGFTEVFPHLISMMFVRGTSAGRGVGRRRMVFAMERAGPGRDGVVRLEATLNAQSFYEKFGFRKVGESRIVRPSGLKLPTVRMEHRS